MNKLREQIADKMWNMAYMSKEDCGAIADAIIALLQRRMLTKDEAGKLLDYFNPTDEWSPGGFRDVLAKLKLIQEEDS